MATSIASLLQGSAPTLQPGGINLQGSAPTIQGSSPSLQVTTDPNTLNPNAVIQQPRPLASVPAPTVPAPTNPNATTAPVLPDRTNDINQNKSALDATRSMLTNGLGSVRDTLSGLFGRYGTEATGNEAQYSTGSDQNKNNFLKGIQSALLHAAQGRQGLFGILASLGALNGSGVDLATHAVQSGANEDISGANDTFATNQSGLDTGIGAFRTADEQRRQDAAAAAAEAEKAVRADVAQKQQSIYGNLSNDYADMGNTGEAKVYSDLLASLFPDIAANSSPGSTPTYQAAQYSPAPLTSFLNGGTTVSATPSAGLPNMPGLMASYIAPAKKKLA